MTTPEDTTTWEWRMPEAGRGADQLKEAVAGIVSPYHQDRPPICYPGATVNLLDPEVSALFMQWLSGQFNNIGCHTHGEMIDGVWHPMPGEGCFDPTQLKERQALMMVAGLIGGNIETVDGYFCGGGTEANQVGVLIGREWTRQQQPTPPRQGEIILGTGLSHYSLYQAFDFFGMGRTILTDCPNPDCGRKHRFRHRTGRSGEYAFDNHGPGFKAVGMNERGEMDLADLERVYRKHYDRGFRRFILAPTVGTCLLGSIDPIEEIARFAQQINDSEKAAVYIHVDAAFAGFTIPFADPDYKFAFEHPAVQSITIDGHKMGRLPYQAGIFLCRKGLQSLIALEVAYVRQSVDDTILGSRSGAIPTLAWYLWQQIGFEGQQRYVRELLQRRDSFVQMVQERYGPEGPVQVMPHPKSVNMLPLMIDVVDGAIPKNVKDHGVFHQWCMRADEFSPGPHDSLVCPSTTVYKLCIMPHVTDRVFLDFLTKLDETLRAHGKLPAAE